VAARSLFALVTWSPPLPQEKGLQLDLLGYDLFYRREVSPDQNETSSLKWHNAGPLAGTATSAGIYSLTANTSYFVRVRAFNAAGNGAFVSVAMRTQNQAVPMAEDNTSQEKETKHAPQVHIWLVVVGVFVVTFVVIGLGISLLLIRGCDCAKLASAGQRRGAAAVGSVVGAAAAAGSSESTEEEAMELVPHITLNPSFNIDMLEYFEASASSSPAHAQARNEEAIVAAAAARKDRQSDSDDEVSSAAASSSKRRTSRCGGQYEVLPSR